MAKNAKVTKDAKYVKYAKHTKNAKDAKDTKDIKDVKNINDAYLPIKIIQHTNKVKFKSYVFSIETKEWSGTGDYESAEGVFGGMVETNVFLEHAQCHNSYERGAIEEHISLKNIREKIMDGKPDNYPILLHRLVKKELEEKLDHDPKAYLASIKGIVEEYRQRKRN